MGFILSKSMDANLTKQQEFMLHNSRLQVSCNVVSMGFILSKSMDANLTKQQEFMLHNSRLQVSCNVVSMGFILSKSMDANLTKQQEFMLHNSRLQIFHFSGICICSWPPTDTLRRGSFNMTLTTTFSFIVTWKFQYDIGDSLDDNDLLLKFKRGKHSP
nr:plasminogen receptor (KT) isoform X4 [Syngnathus scovelli]